jgi:tetrahydromethanopterin S-methyltransferase subunit E
LAPFEASGIATKITGSPSVVGEIVGGVVATDDVATNFDVLANDSDVDGDTLSITGLSEVTDADGNIIGTLSVVNVNGVDQVQFTPDATTFTKTFETVSASPSASLAWAKSSSCVKVIVPSSFIVAVVFSVTIGASFVHSALSM